MARELDSLAGAVHSVETETAVAALAEATRRVASALYKSTLEAPSIIHPPTATVPTAE